MRNVFTKQRVNNIAWGYYPPFPCDMKELTERVDYVEVKKMPFNDAMDYLRAEAKKCPLKVKKYPYWMKVYFDGIPNHFFERPERRRRRKNRKRRHSQTLGTSE